jgi:hypothetical protein
MTTAGGHAGITHPPHKQQSVDLPPQSSRLNVGVSYSESKVAHVSNALQTPKHTIQALLFLSPSHRLQLEICL